MAVSEDPEVVGTEEGAQAEDCTHERGIRLVYAQTDLVVAGY